MPLIMRMYESNELNYENSQTIAFHTHCFNSCNMFVQKNIFRNLSLHLLHLEGFVSSRRDTIHFLIVSHSLHLKDELMCPISF